MPFTMKLEQISFRKIQPDEAGSTTHYSPQMNTSEVHVETMPPSPFAGIDDSLKWLVVREGDNFTLYARTPDSGSPLPSYGSVVETSATNLLRFEFPDVANSTPVVWPLAGIKDLETLQGGNPPGEPVLGVYESVHEGTVAQKSVPFHSGGIETFRVECGVCCNNSPAYYCVNVFGCDCGPEPVD